MEELDKIFSWDQSSKESPLQQMERNYENREHPPHIYGFINNKRGWTRIRGYFVMRLDGSFVDGHSSVEIDTDHAWASPYVHHASINNFLSSISESEAIDSFVLLKSNDDDVYDLKSLMLKLQRLNPGIFRSRSRIMARVKNFLRDNNMEYVNPGRRIR